MNTDTPIQEDIRQDWKADLDNEKNVTLDDLKFIFAQAEKRVDDGIKNFDATTTKSISFITLTAALVTALAAYFFVNFEPGGVFSPKLTTVLVCAIYTFYVLYTFVQIVLPIKYEPIGSFPQDLYQDRFFTHKINADAKSLNESTLILYTGELENYNHRIFHNDQANQKRLDLFNKSVNCLIVMPGIGLLVYFLLLGLSSLF